MPSFACASPIARTILDANPGFLALLSRSCAASGLQESPFAQSGFESPAALHRLATSVHALELAPTCAPCGLGTVAGTDDGAIDVTYTAGTSDHVDGRGDPAQGPAPGRTSWIVVEENTAPACSTNSRLNANSVCPAALTTCANGLIRFWVWHQVTTFTRDAAGVMM